MWQVGADKRQLEMDFSGLELLGWGQPEGRIERVAEPLWIRGVVLCQGDQRWVYVCAELCFITQSIRDGVLKILAERGRPLEARELVITATHTHSGPSGYGHELFYNLTNPGHSLDAYHCVVSTIADTVQAAFDSLEPGRVWVNRGEIPMDEPVAFNRALPAFVRNVDAPPIDVSRPETATNRDLTVLRIDGDSGPRAAICWFAVHNTSVHFDNRALHGDNKGVAAALVESFATDTLDRPGFVGIFAQGASGDVTPNYRPSNRGFTIGHHDDDFESAQFHGEIQARYALPLFQAHGEELHDLDTHTRYLDFDGAKVEPRFSGDRSNQTTGAARYGLGFIEGTAEGPGPLWRAQVVRRSLVRAVAVYKRLRGNSGNRSDVYGPMFPFLDAGLGAGGKAFGLFSMRVGRVPHFIDPVIKAIQHMEAAGADIDHPWTPSVLPLHITRIGHFALVSMPSEPTTTAGRRIAQTVGETLGATCVQVGGYSNAYHGYVTTNEEYQVQAYEGAHTIYGQWTLGAYQTALSALALEMNRPMSERDADTLQPHRHSAEEVGRRAYKGPPPTRNWG